ncbi:hypothetical protein HPY42_03725 [Coprothermobacteraceae bacterium]|nr:hypothetical protein [Coprothermobacteraceae bacterium]
MAKEKLLLGQFGKVHGVRGEIYFSLFGTEDILQRAANLYLKDGTSLRILGIRRSSKGRFILKVEGYDTPEDAKALVNQNVYVEAMEGEGDIYTVGELRSMTLVFEGRPIGRILNLEGDEAPYLVVEVDGATRLVPFTRQALRIDRQTRTVELLDEGLMV